MHTPLFILSGFLGSGKTTLLLRLLNEARERGLRPGIMMNELGRQDVDGRIVDEFAQFPVERLLDGCVCCNKKEELAGSLRLLLQQRPDIIFIELTGVANPEEIAAVIAESFGNDIHSSRIVTVLDAEHVLEYNSIFSTDRLLVQTLRRQIEAANMLVVNKTDLVSSRKLKKIEKVIAKQNESAAIVYTVHSQIDHHLIFAEIQPRENRISAAQPFRIIKGNSSVEAESHSGHSHAKDGNGNSYSKVKTVTLPVPVDAEVDKQTLENFLQHNEQQLIRAKGYIRLSDRTHLIQYAGNRITYSAASYPGKPYLVVIGMNLNESQLLDYWLKACDRKSLNRESHFQ
jgi:G3E family GTPase